MAMLKSRIFVVNCIGRSAIRSKATAMGPHWRKGPKGRYESSFSMVGSEIEYKLRKMGAWTSATASEPMRL